MDRSLVSTAERSARASGSYVSLSGTQLVCPGFIDTHTHASQYTFMGVGRIPLLDWLQKYTFPAEQRLADPKAAREVYDRAVRAYVRGGTTTACCTYHHRPSRSPPSRCSMHRATVSYGGSSADSFRIRPYHT